VEKPGYINDQWVLNDTLGMGRAGDALARMALEVTPPFTIGVTGKWGSGKTSVLRRAFATLGGLPISQSLQLGNDKTELPEEQFKRLEHHLREEELGWKDINLHLAANRSLCVWYSPWQHQSAENPLVPLLQELHAQYSGKRKLKQNFSELNRQGGLAALALLEHAIDAALTMQMEKPVKLAAGVSENIRKAWSEDNSANLAKLSDGQRFHLLFEDAVENLLADLKSLFATEEKKLKKQFPGQSQIDNHSRLIIFIDDLDRCEEKAVVGLLEAIKLYLGTRRCVFVLGIDDVAVAEALERHWQGRNDDHNREYLEKLFQATVPVPLPRDANLQQMICSQLLAHGFPEQAVLSLAENITGLLEPNPRKVKNFLNSLCASWQVLRCPDMETPENCRLLLMFQYLRQYHRPVWRILERQPELLPILHRELIDSPLPISGLPSYIDPDALHMTREIFSRAFSHVLKPLIDQDDPLYHRRQTLDVAVNRFLERLDRRRSDEYFIDLAKKYLDANTQLHPMYLRITEIEEPAP